MGQIGSSPVSASNLSASLGAGASGGIGSRPISVDNLKAVLDARGVDILYDGPRASGTVRIDRSMEGYDYIAIETVSKVGAGSRTEDVYGMVCATPQAIAEGYEEIAGLDGRGFWSNPGEICDGPGMPSLNVGIGFPASGSYTAVHLTDNDALHAVLRVFGMRFKEGTMRQAAEAIEAGIAIGGGQLVADVLAALAGGEA